MTIITQYAVPDHASDSPEDTVTLFVDMNIDDDDRYVGVSYATQYSHPEDQAQWGGYPGIVVARDTVIRVKLNPFRWWTFADDLDGIALTAISDKFSNFRMIGPSGNQVRYNEARFEAVFDRDGEPGSTVSFALNVDIWIDSATATRVTLYPDDITNPKPPHQSHRMLKAWPEDITNPKPPQSVVHTS